MSFKIKRTLVTLMALSLFSINLYAEPDLPQSEGDETTPYFKVKKQGHNETSVPEGVSGFKKFLNRTQLSGYLDVEFDSDGGTSNASSFDAHRFVLGVSSQLNSWLSMNSEIELEHGGLGIPNEDKVAVEQAFIDASLHDLLTFRMGVILIPMGRVNILHDANLLDFTARPLATSVIVPSTWSEVGVGIHGFHNFENNMAINYEFYVTNGLASPNGDGNILGSTGNRGIRNGFSGDNNSDKAFSGRLGFSPLLGMEFGVSAYTANLSTKGSPSNRLTMIGGDFRYQSKSWEIGESNTILGPIEVHGEVFKTFLDSAKTGGVAGQFGGYGQVNFHWFPGAFRGVLPGGTFTNSFRYNYVDTNTAAASTDEINRFEVGFNFRPIEPFVLKTEYQINWGSSTAANNNDRFLASAALAF